MLNFFTTKEMKEGYKTVEGKVILVKEWPVDRNPSKDPWTRHSQLNK